MTTPGNDVIDSRDIIARLEELQDELDCLEDAQAIAEWHEDNDDEYLPLVELNKECEGYSDWTHGETLIHRSYWVEYCREMLDDFGVIPKDLPSYVVIDMEATADNLEADYTTVDYDGHEYLIRNC